MVGSLGAADLVDGLRQLRLDVIAVKRDLSVGQVLQSARQKRLAHILADLGDLLGGASVRLQVGDEALVGGGATALGDEDRAAAIQVGEHGHVLLATTRAGLVDAQPTDLGEILQRAGSIDVVMHDPPQARVVLADEAGDRVAGISLASAITSASNSSVNPEPGRAHGSAT